MKRYEVIESKVWLHTSGATASIYGAVPWTNESTRPLWRIVSRGWTIRDNYNNTVGMGRPPFTSRDNAQAMINKWGNPDL